MTTNRRRTKPKLTIEDLLKEERKPGREFNPGVYFDFKEKYNPTKLYMDRWLRIVVGQLNAKREFSEAENNAAWKAIAEDLEKAYPRKTTAELREMVEEQAREFERLKNGQN